MVDNARFLYVFGEFSLDPLRRSFRKNGEEIHLPAKEFDTLLYFIENPGRVLTKDEMMSAIWEDTFVEEGNLAQYVSRLRKLLGSNGHSFIQTLPKKGYRFDADIETVSANVGSNEPFRPSWFALMIAAAVLIFAALAIWVAYPTKVSPNIVSAQADPAAPVPLTDGNQDDGVIEWTSDNHIRFLRRVSLNRYESWIANLDGSDAHRETTPIKDFIYGFFSPDGRKVYFMKEGDPKTTYLANADGTDEIKLPLLVGNSDWAPDGSKFVYETKLGDNTEIFLYTLATRENLNLTHNNVFDADPSFAPDGQHIVFLSSRNGNADIYMMDLNGENVRQLTDHPAFDRFPTISPDGTQVLFMSNRDGPDDQLYIKNLGDDSPPVKITDMAGIEGTRERCWSPDGTQIIFTSSTNGKEQVFRINAEAYKAEKLLADSDADLEFPRVSPDGSHLVYQARRDDHRIELRNTDLLTKTTKTIFTSSEALPATFILSANWSPDGTKIVFDDRADDNIDIYEMNADGTGVSRLTDDPEPDLGPVFSPNGKSIYFARDFYGKPRVFVLDLDNRKSEAVMSKGGYEMSPAVTPDGKGLLFSADRQDGHQRGLDILQIELDKPDLEATLVSRIMHESQVNISPDGKRMVFEAQSDSNPEVYIANLDGSDVVRLTRDPKKDLFPTFSLDGHSVIFCSDRDGRFAIYELAVPF